MSSILIDNSWIYDIQDAIYSRLDAVCTAKLGTKYRDINVTTDSHKVTSAKFPNVYIQFLAVEGGKDLDNQNTNAIYLTAIVDVTVALAQKMEVAREVTNVVLNCMKEMRFDVNQIPEFNDTDSEYRTISRFARWIGYGEELF